jgi:peroxisomal 2,4-dienoyl-CoA reductase
VSNFACNLAGIKLTRFCSGPENEKAAAQLEKETGRSCLPCQADVRKPEDLKAAAKKAFEKYGRIDYVICGAAGNLWVSLLSLSGSTLMLTSRSLSPIEGLSENAFKTVVDIDLVRYTSLPQRNGTDVHL